LRRPRLLFAAARAGLAGYRPERDLRRLIGSAPDALAALAEAEAEAERTRRQGAAGYSAARHVGLLIALLAEQAAQARAAALP
jgi:hypothetical protein